jgi:peptidoglycan L-alanyl-D-glutamate endopeptidase CwlK
LAIKNEKELAGVHPDLVKLVKAVGAVTDIHVIDGLRTPAEAAKNLANGKSQTTKSRHLTGHAVDLGVLVKGKLVWEPWSLYAKLAETVKAQAKKLGIPIEWGGDWKTLKDGVHFQLPWNKYK